MAKNTEAVAGVLGTLALKEMIWTWMAENGAKLIQAEFNGEGDSGTFEESPNVFFYNPHAGEAWQDETPEQQRVQTEFRQTKLTVLISDQGEGRTLGDVVRDFSMEIEQKTEHGVDWWNNDGGRGQVAWVLDGAGPDGRHYRRGICLEVEERVVSFEAHHHAIEGNDDPGEGEGKPCHNCGGLEFTTDPETNEAHCDACGQA